LDTMLSRVSVELPVIYVIVFKNIKIQCFKVFFIQKYIKIIFFLKLFLIPIQKNNIKTLKILI